MTIISLKGKKIIIFDLDGTIVKLAGDWKALKEILIEKYREIYKTQIDFPRISKCLENIVEKKDDQVLENFFNIIRQYELANIKNIQLIDETIFFINNKELFGINKKVKFAVLSLNTRDTIIKSLEMAKIRDKIDLIVGKEDVRRWKPFPDGLIKIQKYYKVYKKDMIYFGDLDNDLLTGKNAGIEAHLIGDLIELVKKIEN
ncbi:MAG: HAD family hydrolase [Promethearchaeota archaeon]